MHNISEIENLIESRLDEMSPKQKKLARFILQEKYFASFASAAEIGEKVGASAATVVRFAQFLGYAGFHDFQKAIQSILPSYLTSLERVDGMGSSASGEEGVANLYLPAFNDAIDNIKLTMSRLDGKKFEEAVDLILGSEFILVAGAGISAAPASYLAHSLRVLGFMSHAPLGRNLEMVTELMASEGKKRILMAIGFWRYVRCTVEAVEMAHEAGIPIIALTDSKVSPIARASTYAFEVAVEGSTYSRSMAATLALIDAFLSGIYVKDPKRSAAALRKVDRAYRDHKVLFLE